ncbi:MAG: heme o synthase [Patescibacteria group bacterium]|nr:heme o synthase [Patescibacteria group bacterium]
MKHTTQAYYTLTKPGIVRGNALHTFAGALLASTLPIGWTQVLGVVAGTSLVIASACVVNNIIDRNIDARMKRTKNRPSVTGKVGVRAAIIYAGILFLMGMAALTAWTNTAVLIIGIVAYGMYVVVYGWAKRSTIHSTVIGAIPGALPAMAGYVAVSHEVSLAAWLVFLVVFAWQMPHFYAISLFRKEEYRKARLPVLGVQRSFEVVRRAMFAYLLLYLLAIITLMTTATVGVPTGLLLLAGAVYWIAVFFQTSIKDEAKWARAVFGVSLVLSLVFLIASAINIYLPAIS